MSDEASGKGSDDGGKLGFLDSLGRLFGAKSEAPAPAPEAEQTPAGFSRLEADFDAALRSLKQRVEEQRRAATGTAPGTAHSALSAEELAAEKQRRRQASHRAMREDIEKMHGRLRTGLPGAELDSISGFLVELDETSSAGRDSFELVPRARHTIAERLLAEAGELAVERLVSLLGREGLDWPDPTHHRQSETPEEVERSRRRRLSDVREAFLAQDLRRTAERLYGLVGGWGADYPERGSPLWEETVLEGVAAGIRGQQIREFVEVLRDERELLLSRTEDAVGKELAALHSALESNAGSAEQAKRVLASSLRVLDHAVPDIAWEIVRSRRPEARGAG